MKSDAKINSIACSLIQISNFQKTQTQFALVQIFKKHRRTWMQFVKIISSEINE